MADLRGQQLKDSYQNVVTRGTGNKLENGNGVEFADLDDKASLSAINNDENFYEEGTWTPGSNSSQSLNVNFSKYIKVGNKITVEFSLSLTGTDTSTSTFRITGLPFSCESNINGTVQLRGVSIDAGTIYPVTNALGASGTEFGITQVKDNSGPSFLEINAINDGASIIATLTYLKE